MTTIRTSSHQNADDHDACAASFQKSVQNDPLFERPTSPIFGTLLDMQICDFTRKSEVINVSFAIVTWPPKIWKGELMKLGMIVCILVVFWHFVHVFVEIFMACKTTFFVNSGMYYAMLGWRVPSLLNWKRKWRGLLTIFQGWRLGGMWKWMGTTKRGPFGVWQILNLLSSSKPCVLHCSLWKAILVFWFLGHVTWMRHHLETGVPIAVCIG